MGEKAEVITQGKQGIFMNLPSPFVIQVGKDPSVLPQQAMDITYKIVWIVKRGGMKQTKVLTTT